jgi:metal-responsive CopG/Arc/MetJ family transcriptional regulator
MVIRISVSIPRTILEKIDTERGDIPRSRYLVRILEKELKVRSGLN